MGLGLPLRISRQSWREMKPGADVGVRSSRRPRQGGPGIHRQEYLFHVGRNNSGTHIEASIHGCPGFANAVRKSTGSNDLGVEK